MDWSVYKCHQNESNGVHPWMDTRGQNRRGVCQVQFSDCYSCQQEASLSGLQPCGWILAAQHLLLVGSPTRHCSGLSTCDIQCYQIDCRGHVLLPGTTLHWQNKHEVESKMAFSRLPPTGSCSNPKQGDRLPPKMQEMWYSDQG